MRPPFLLPCRAPSSLQYPAALHANASAVAVTGLRLNGHTLVKTPLRSTQASSADGCQTVLYRVPTRSLSEGFVLTGWLGLASSAGAAWGVGEQSSVELQFGEFKLVSPLLQGAEHEAEQWQVVSRSGGEAAAQPAG